jgi:hypothetical protein
MHRADDLFQRVIRAIIPNQDGTGEDDVKSIIEARGRLEAATKAENLNAKSLLRGKVA